MVQKEFDAAAEGEAAAAKTLSELEASQAQLNEAQAECGGMQEALSRQAANLATAEERVKQLEEQLAERMRWIESLETTQTLHRKQRRHYRCLSCQEHRH